MARGYVHVYTGEGKGKTTAALGLVVRCVGSGRRAAVVQFLKGQVCAELGGLGMLGGRVNVSRCGSSAFVTGAPSQRDIAHAREGLERARSILADSTYGVVVLDEICVALSLGLLDVGEVLGALRERADGVEVVLTGRGAPQEIVNEADLVTEMRKVKHYYDAGVRARAGIEH